MKKPTESKIAESCDICKNTYPMINGVPFCEYCISRITDDMLGNGDTANHERKLIYSTNMINNFANEAVESIM